MSEFELSRLFLALVCLLGLAHGLGYLCQRLGMPRVIGEIMAGVVLGPSLLGSAWPGAHAALFDAFPEQREVLAAFHWIGLVALMFTSGFRVQRRLDREEVQLIGVILAASTVLPFAAGWCAPLLFDFGPYAGPADGGLALTLVVAIAFSVTSIPVISKIFMDLGIMDSPFARIVLAAATIHDLILWVALSVATGIAEGTAPSPLGIALTILKTIVFLALALVFGPRLLRRAGWTRFNLVMKASVTGYLFVVCFLFVALASLLDVNLVFGALVAGMVVGSLPERRYGAVRMRIADVSSGLFVPLYFALVGLAIDLGRDLDLAFTGGFLAVSSAIQIASVGICTRLSGRDRRTALNFGIAMNTRGGPGIVLASVALGAGIIDATFYVALVVAAIATSLGSGIWFRWRLARDGRLM